MLLHFPSWRSEPSANLSSLLFIAKCDMYVLWPSTTLYLQHSHTESISIETKKNEENNITYIVLGFLFSPIA